ncbi:single-stranded-DNA-specific exonuclease RecJ [Acidithiobacillus sp. IBUN Pt1247-S3]|uniref:single-stranded-DNA-specific exonuclease RecJ n=1 Tax=Acidithiobacillus sp. IBUN Pt1247-S3 TaxID=3166642 RepID=UPI0034E472B8
MLQSRPVSPEALAALQPLRLDPVLARLYASRGIRAPDDLDLGVGKLLTPSLLGLRESVARLQRAIQEKELICVVGDWDVDGATSTALAVTALRAFGAVVEYRLPNRFAHGYGLSPLLVEEVLAPMRPRPALLLTVDNGIAAIAGVASAKKYGMEVIVTDHHLPGDAVPDTPWIVNPHQPGCPFPAKTLCGVGVVWYLMAALWRSLTKTGVLPAEPRLPMQWLDLVALGTVADLVPLDTNNRRLVAAGLRQIRKGNARPGIGALMTVSGCAVESVSAQDFGFRLGPRLNAAGRLDDMRIGVELLLERDGERALEKAKTLDAINRERREVQHEGLQSAQEILETLSLPEEEKILVVFDEQGHEGVVGLVAGAIRESRHRPAIVFAPAEEGRAWRGSARSVPGVHIRDFLARLDGLFPGMIDKFGGHAMAAGLGLRAEQAERFRREAARLAESFVDDSALTEVVWTDGEIPAGWGTLENVSLLEAAGPWGQGFPDPLFQGTFRLVTLERIGADKQTRKMTLATAEGESHLALQFRCGEPDASELQAGSWYTVAYQLQINRWRGQETVQRIVQKIGPAVAPEIPSEPLVAACPEDGVPVGGEFLELDEFEACK